MKRVFCLLAGLGLVLGMAAACRQSDLRAITVHVPQMEGARAVRIVTNAALDAVSAVYDRRDYNCQVDLARQVVLYHEGNRLLDAAYQRRIVACIREVGFDAQLVTVARNPYPPIPRGHKPPITTWWQDRVTAAIVVANLRTQTDANVIAQAITHARIGGDDPRLRVDPVARTVTGRYESLVSAQRNIEHAIALAGFDANDVNARLGREDAIPSGWEPVRLGGVGGGAQPGT